MLPNRFPDDGSVPTEGDYDNADGTVSKNYSQFKSLISRRAISAMRLLTTSSNFVHYGNNYKVVVF